MKRLAPGILLVAAIAMTVVAAVGFVASLEFGYADRYGWLPWLFAVLFVNGLVDIAIAVWMKRRQHTVSAPPAA